MAKVVNYQVLVFGHAEPIRIKADTVQSLHSPDNCHHDLQFMVDGTEIARFARQSVIGFWVD